MNQPNILLIIWDACRFDYAMEHASFLNELGSSNVSFRNTIAPSPWSLPSHASIFSGKYPHEHNSCRFSDSINTPLVSELSNNGYTTYGVSANGFASQRTGFDEDFDEFRYTGGRDIYPSGMDVSGTAQRILRESKGTHSQALREILKRIPSHENYVKILVNLLAVGCGELANKFESLQRIRHPIFAPTSDYSYKPESNTRTIRSMIRSHDNEEPFFLFTNYMDTHRCYKPNPELQEKHIGRILGYDELVRLNEEVAAPWAFESKKIRGKLRNEDIETLRDLYAGEVETADRHLRKIHELLDEQGMLEDTLIVVTADHGENLGETDEMGRQRMGHEASVSDAVLRVPLVVAHPELDAATVNNKVTLNFLYQLFVSVADNDHSDVLSESWVCDAIPDTPAVSQYPAKGGGDKTLKKYPGVPEETVRHGSSENSVIAYGEGWKVVTESTGERWSFSDGEIADIARSPEPLVALTERHLEQLSNTGKRDLSDDQVSQLEDLGYI